MSGAAFTEGIAEHQINGVSVRIYSPAKTVVGCFRFRNRLGLDVALEALRDIRRRRRAILDELWRLATLCRVGSVMKAYLEALA